MVKMKKTLVLKKIVFVILFVLFYIYYLTPIIDGWKNDHYWKELTSFANVDAQISYKDVIEVPAITICFKPKFKPSVFENYNITEDIFFQEKFPNLTDKKSIKVQT